MSKKGITIQNYHSFDRDTQLELNKINKYIVETIYTKGHYHNGLRFLRVVAKKFDELGIRSDIYYKMASIQNIINNSELSKKRTIANCQTFDIYLECMNQKDYRNAMKMLKIYQENNSENSDFIKLHLALVHIKISQFEQAQTLLSEVSESQHENPLYYAAQLELFYKKKEYEKAVELLPAIEKYDGHTDYKLYIRIAKAFILLGKEMEANQVFNIILSIVKSDELAMMILKETKNTAIEENSRQHPSRRENRIAYQIALDEKNYESAAIYLEKVIEQSADGNFIAQNKKQLRQLKQLIKKDNN